VIACHPVAFTASERCHAAAAFHYIIPAAADGTKWGVCFDDVGKSTGNSGRVRKGAIVPASGDGGPGASSNMEAAAANSGEVRCDLVGIERQAATGNGGPLDPGRDAVGLRSTNDVWGLRRRFQTERPLAIGLEFQRLIVGRPKEVYASGCSGIAAQLPKVCGTQSAQGRGIHVGHARAIAGKRADEDVGGIIKCHALAKRARQARAVHAERMDRVRGRRHLGARGQQRETRAAVAAHANFQPPIRAREHPRSKIQRDREQAVADGCWRIGERPGYDSRATAGIVNREL
jgi:hypothetical protein